MMKDRRGLRSCTSLNWYQKNRFQKSYHDYPNLQWGCQERSGPYASSSDYYFSWIFMGITYGVGNEKRWQPETIYEAVVFSPLRIFSRDSGRSKWWNVQREKDIHMQIMNVSFWSYAFRIQEFRSKILGNGGQYFSECNQCQVLFSWRCYSFSHSRESCEAFKECTCVTTQAWTSYPAEELLIHATWFGTRRELHSRIGIHVDERKLRTIRNAHPTRSKKQVKYFLGIASYCRRFIKDLAKISRPLSEKTSKKVEFLRTSRMQKSFYTLKQAFTIASVLGYPDFSKPFIVATGAPRAAVGAVLLLLDENGREHPIYYANWSLSVVWKNYSTCERKVLLIVFVLKKFWNNLLIQESKLFTDHEPLEYVISNRESHGRIARWISIFSEYDFEVVYRPDTRNANVDYLPRAVCRFFSVLIMELEAGLSSVAEYRSRVTIDRTSPSVTRAIKVHGKNYYLHDSDLYHEKS